MENIKSPAHSRSSIEIEQTAEIIAERTAVCTKGIIRRVLIWIGKKIRNIFGR